MNDPDNEALADAIMENGAGKPPPSDAPLPPPLTPTNVEELMRRALASPGFRALLSDADLGPTCQAVQQIVHNGLKAQDPQPLAIMVMMASWALWKWQREQDDLAACNEALDSMGGAD